MTRAAEYHGKRIGYAERPRRDVASAWLLPLAPAALYLLTLSLRYALVPPACGSPGARVVLEGVALLGLVGAAVPGVLGWRALRREQVVRPGELPWSEGSRALLHLIAVLTSVFFALLVLATWIPSWIVSPCHS